VVIVSLSGKINTEKKNCVKTNNKGHLAIERTRGAYEIPNTDFTLDPTQLSHFCPIVTQLSHGPMALPAGPMALCAVSAFELGSAVMYSCIHTFSVVLSLTENDP